MFVSFPSMPLPCLYMQLRAGQLIDPPTTGQSLVLFFDSGSKYKWLKYLSLLSSAGKALTWMESLKGFILGSWMNAYVFTFLQKLHQGSDVLCLEWTPWLTVILVVKSYPTISEIIDEIQMLPNWIILSSHLVHEFWISSSYDSHSIELEQFHGILMW